MKILFSIPSLYRDGGGIVQAIPREAEELVRLGHEVRIITARTRDYSEATLAAEKNGVTIYREPIRRHFGLECLYVTRPYLHRLRELVAWADITHVNCLWMDASWLTAWLCRRMGKKYVFQTHGALNPVALQTSPFRKKIIGNIIERGNLNRAAAVLATAQSEREGIERFGITSPIKVVPIGIDTFGIDGAQRDPACLKHFGLDVGKRTLLFLARVSPGKGLDLLAEAWSHLTWAHRDWQLLIVGPDDRGYTEIIKEQFDRLVRDGSVTFSGPVFGEEKFRLLKSVDAFVMPSRSENFNISVQEALAAGLPTICTKGAPWEEIQTHGAGAWVETSVEGLKAGLTYVLGADGRALRNMSSAALELIATNYQWPSVVSSLLTAYRFALKSS